MPPAALLAPLVTGKRLTPEAIAEIAASDATGSAQRMHSRRRAAARGPDIRSSDAMTVHTLVVHQSGRAFTSGGDVPEAESVAERGRKR